MKQKFLTSCAKCIITLKNFQVHFMTILKPTRANINMKQDKEKTIKYTEPTNIGGDQTIENKGGRIWNNLQANIKHINNVKIFSDEIKNLKLLQYQ